METKDQLPIQTTTKKDTKLLTRKKIIPVWRHPDYRDNLAIISWMVPYFYNGIPLVGPELLTKVALPKAMNLYEYEEWSVTDEGHAYLKKLFPMCDAIAEKIDKEKEVKESQENAKAI